MKNFQLFRHVGALDWIILAVFGSMILVGCGVRLSDPQAAQLSQGRENIIASRQAPGDQEKRILSTAADARVMSATHDLPLPAPEKSAEELLRNAEAAAREARDANEAEKHPPAGVSAETLGIIGGGLATALAIARFVPLGPLTPLLAMAGEFIKPKETREDAAKMQVVVSSLVDFADDLEAIICKAGPEFQQMMKDLKTEHARTQNRLKVRHIVDGVLS